MFAAITVSHGRDIRHCNIDCDVAELGFALHVFPLRIVIV